MGERDAWTSQIVPLDTERLVRALAHHSVEYLFVGGLAAVLHRWSGSTFDVDVLAARDPANLERLAAALDELRARVYADPNRTDLRGDGSPPEADLFDGTGASLARLTAWSFMTDAGELDVLFVLEPRGTYEQLAPTRRDVPAFGLTLPTVGLEDLIALKRELGRPKDLRMLAELEELLEEQRRQEPGFE